MKEYEFILLSFDKSIDHSLDSIPLFNSSRIPISSIVKVTAVLEHLDTGKRIEVNSKSLDWNWLNKVDLVAGVKITLVKDI